MRLPVEELTPRQIVADLDTYIVGQYAAKKAVAVALRNRYRRQQLPVEQREDILPKNILMIGPTGVGKTEIARRLAQLARAPFIKVEATKFTEVGYVGRDVESMVRDLVSAAIRLVEREKTDEIRELVEQGVEDRLVDLLDEHDDPYPQASLRTFDMFGRLVSAEPEPELETPDLAAEEWHARREARREEIRARLRAGEFENRDVEVETEEANQPFMQVFSAQGMEEMGIDTSAPGGPFGSRRVYRKAPVTEARAMLFEEEAKRRLDRSTLTREAIYRAEQTGIIFLDEIDKVGGKSGGSGPDVSREGVQRDLLPIIEGSTVQSKYGPVRTDHILFIAAGAFHISKPSDLIPELQGRLPIRVEMESLGEMDFRRILREPKNALTKQYQALLGVDGVTIEFTDDGLDEIARLAAEVNQKTENIGARRLHTIMEKLLELELFEAPETEAKHVVYDAGKVRERLQRFAQNTELSRNVL